jgi:hypothetical protein
MCSTLMLFYAAIESGIFSLSTPWRGNRASSVFHRRSCAARRTCLVAERCRSADGQCGDNGVVRWRPSPQKATDGRFLGRCHRADNCRLQAGGRLLGEGTSAIAILVEYAGNLFRALGLSGGAWRGRVSLSEQYHRCWKEALGVSILTRLGYVLVLFAVRIAPLSHVAPAREMSMMIGVYLGTRFLNEGHLARRLSGSGLIVAGVAALSSG